MQLTKKAKKIRKQAQHLGEGTITTVKGEYWASYKGGISKKIKFTLTLLNIKEGEINTLVQMKMLNKQLAGYTYKTEAAGVAITQL